MQLDRALADLTFAERLYFLLTNRLPRQAATCFMGWFSKIENPLVRSISIRAWKLFVAFGSIAIIVAENWPAAAIGH